MTLGWNLSIDKLGCSTSQVPDMASTKNNSKANLGLRLVEWAHTKHYSWLIRLNKRLLSIPYYLQKKDLQFIYIIIYIIKIYTCTNSALQFSTRNRAAIQLASLTYSWDSLPSGVHGVRDDVAILMVVHELHTMPHRIEKAPCLAFRIVCQG